MKNIKKILNLLIEKELKQQEPVLKNPHKQTTTDLPNPKSNLNILGKSFKLSLDVNKNPTKKGIKIQFMPEKETEKEIDPVTKRDLQIELVKKLNEGLKQYGMEADIDPDVPYPNVIGFYIRLEFFDKLIRKILNDGKKISTSKEKPTP
jgi:hypothetical protein